MYNVPENKNLRIPYDFEKPDGTSAKVDGTPIVSSSDETVAKVSVDKATKTILVSTVGPGTFTGTISADADLGTGVVSVTATFDVSVDPILADHVVLGDGVVEDKPVA